MELQVRAAVLKFGDRNLRETGKKEKEERTTTERFRIRDLIFWRGRNLVGKTNLIDRIFQKNLAATECKDDRGRHFIIVGT